MDRKRAEKQSGRQTDRQIGTQRQRQKKGAEKQTNGWMNRCAEKELRNSQTHRQTRQAGRRRQKKEAEKQTNRWTDGQKKSRETDGLTDRQPGRKWWWGDSGWGWNKYLQFVDRLMLVLFLHCGFLPVTF